MTPEQRFALQTAHLMLREDRLIYPGFCDNRLGHRVVMNRETGCNDFFLCIGEEGGMVYGDYEPWPGGVDEGMVLGEWDLPWPKTEHERLALLSRIDRALAEGSWSVQPPVEIEEKDPAR